jgi:MFS family permease
MNAWRVVLLVFLFMLINYADKAVIGLSSVPIMHDLGLSSLQFGELGSAFFLLFSVSGVAVGFLANHVRTKSLMLCLALAWGIALLPVGFSSGFGLLLASRITLGAAEGPSFPVAIHALYKWFGDRQRALPTSIVACGAAFGTGVVAPLLTWLIVHHGWRAAFVTLGLTGMGWGAVWYATTEEGPIDAAPPPPGVAARRVPYCRLILCRTTIGIFAAGFAAYWVIALNITWLANYLVKGVHLSPAATAWIVGLPSVMQMLLAPLLSLLSQSLTARGVSTRVSRGVLGGLCVVTAGISMVCMSVVQFGILEVCLIGLSFSVGSVIFTLGPTLIGEIAPPPQRGALLGVTNSFHTLAGLCAPVVMGFFLDRALDPGAGFRSGFFYAGLLVAGLGMLAALLIEPEADKSRFR